jgi:hypothetical protein
MKGAESRAGKGGGGFDYEHEHRALLAPSMSTILRSQSFSPNDPAQPAARPSAES